MSLTDTQIKDLAKRMRVPLCFIGFKDELKGQKLKYNKSYIINMENEFDEDGERNQGSHYTCFQVNKYPNDKKEGLYFDSFGMPPPTIVEEFCGMKLPYATKDIQSLMNSACGWYCLAFLHYINSAESRSGDLYHDAGEFTDIFDDLSKSCDHLKNEFLLKHFFRSADPEKRTPVEMKGMNVVKDPSVPADPKTIITENDDFKGKVGC
jgi:hypothetical protein